MEKNFDKFIDSIDSATLETILFSANQAMNVSKRSGSDAQAFFIAFELLERYHNWIQES